ncbi:hypothetical protein JXB37_04755 [candidate division WOR-3 bacterium]|nr:hypothetical protein [candidate division WOR-3 bacterium]
MPTRDRRRDWLFPAGLVVFALLWLAFFPRTFAIVDEDAYLTQALLLRQGRLTYDDSGIPPPHMTVFTDGRAASKYPPGNSLLILPFTLPGWRLAFLAGLALALLGAWLFRRLLEEVEPGADRAWSLLWLFYPTAVLFSRTLMSDLAAAVFTLAGFLLVARRKWFFAGLVLGLGCLVRYSSGILAVAALALALLSGRGRLRSTALLALGLVPGAALCLGWNWHAYGGPLQFPMYLTGRFHWAYLGRNLSFYLPALLALYPLMLLAPLAVRRGRRLLVALPAGALIAAYLFYDYLPGGAPAEQLLVGLRFLLPAIALLALGYAAALDRVARELRGLAWLRWPVTALLVAAATLVNWRHDQLLKAQAAYQQQLYAAVPEGALLVCNPETSELVTFARGAREWRHYVEFNVPLPLEREIAARDTVYAALLAKPGRGAKVAETVFWSLVFRRPGGEPALEVREPWRLLVYRLKPSLGPASDRARRASPSQTKAVTISPPHSP